MSKLREDFERDGYVIVDVLASGEIDDFRKVMDEMLSENKKTEDGKSTIAIVFEK